MFQSTQLVMKDSDREISQQVGEEYVKNLRANRMLTYSLAALALLIAASVVTSTILNIMRPPRATATA